MVFISFCLTKPWLLQRDMVVNPIKCLKLLVMVVVAITMLHPKAEALQGEGWRELANQVPDIKLEPGAPAYFPVDFKTVELNNTVSGGFLPTDYGLYARSDVPGLSIMCAYGCGGVPPFKIYPPYEWVPIGIADGWVEGNPKPLEGPKPAAQRFNLIFDGTAPEGTQGNIVIAVNEASEFLEPRVIASINVYVSQTPKSTWFRVTGTSATVSGNRLILNHIYLNRKSDANLFVTHVYNAPGHTPMYWNHPVSVSYDTSLERWTIVNDDGAIMPQGIVFNVRIDPSAKVVRSTNWKYPQPLGSPPVCEPPFERVHAIPIRHPSADWNPYATIIVTPRSPHDHPIAVRYITPTWYVVRVSSDPLHAGLMPSCGVYNVQVIGFSSYYDDPRSALMLDRFSASNAAGVTGGSENSSGPRNLWFWWQLGNPNEPIVVTQTLSLPVLIEDHYDTRVSDPAFVGLSYAGAPTPQWQIVNEDGTDVPGTASFNTWGQPQLTPLPYR